MILAPAPLPSGEFARATPHETRHRASLSLIGNHASAAFRPRDGCGAPAPTAGRRPAYWRSSSGSIFFFGASGAASVARAGSGASTRGAEDAAVRLVTGAANEGDGAK